MIPSPAANVPVSQQAVQLRKWSSPSLLVESIAIITEGGFSSLTDNCGNPDGGMCP